MEQTGATTRIIEQHRTTIEKDENSFELFSIFFWELGILETKWYGNLPYLLHPTFPFYKPSTAIYLDSLAKNSLNY